MAYALLVVAAIIASAGVILYKIQASDTIWFMFPEGQLPGLKSEQMATGNPASIIFLAGGEGNPKKS